MAIVKGLNPLVILKNREKLARKLVDKYHFTEADLANFFYANPSVMGKFLKETGITPGNEQTPENKQEADRLRIARDKKIRRDTKDGELAKALEQNGLWNLPEVKNVSIEALDDFPGAISAKNAMEFLQFGFTFTNVKSYFGLSRVQIELIQEAFKNEGISHGVELRTSKESFETVKDMVFNGHEYETAVKATGFSSAPNEKRFFSPESRKTYSYEDYVAYKTKTRERQNEYEREKNGSSPSKSYDSPEKEALKEEVFRRWTSAKKTQEELAKEYGVSRVTIMNWCREMKVKHRGEIEQPTVRRRNLSEKTLKERGLSSYDNPGMMRLKTDNSKEQGGSAAGYDSPFRAASDEKREKVSDISKEIYKKKTSVLFGYGPNEGESMENGVKKSGYQVRRIEATQLGEEFASVEGARQHADENGGEMKSFWDEKYGPSEEPLDEDEIAMEV